MVRQIRYMTHPLFLELLNMQTYLLYKNVVQLPYCGSKSIVGQYLAEHHIRK